MCEKGNWFGAETDISQALELLQLSCTKIPNPKVRISMSYCLSPNPKVRLQSLCILFQWLRQLRSLFFICDTLGENSKD